MNHDSKTASPTRVLARWVSTLTYDALPPRTREIVRIALLDALGAGVYGYATPWTKMLLDWARAGTIGAKTTVRAAPDGYTIAVVSGSYATNAALYKLPYDPINDIAPISLLGETGFLLTVHPSVPVKSTKELIAYERDIDAAQHRGGPYRQSTGNEGAHGGRRRRAGRRIAGALPRGASARRPEMAESREGREDHHRLVTDGA